MPNQTDPQVAPQETEDVADPILVQVAYGAFRTRYLCFLPLLGLIGVVGIPLGFLYNEGWVMNNHPLEPWSATLIIEIFAIGALMLFIVVIAATVVRRKSPQRIAVTKTRLMVPKGMFSNVELDLPLSELDLTVFDVGFVQQLQIKHKRRKIILTSARFATAAEFDRLVEHLPV